MSEVIFISGDFCSGSTLLFTLFRETREYYCLYEPLHEHLREYMIWPLRVYEHHYFVEDYFREYKGFTRIRGLFNPAWASRNLFLRADDRMDDLRAYLSYLIETASQRQEKVLLKFNRATFRLPWLRKHFPQAKIVHIHRDPESQWKSIVARGQEHLGRADIGQDSAHFQGFGLASWCEDLKGVFPELDAARSKTGFERFSKLHARSLAAHREYADLSLEYRSLCKNFEPECRRMFQVTGCEAEIAKLKPLIVPPDKQKRPPRRDGLKEKTTALVDRAGLKYARARVRLYDSVGA